MSVSVDRVTAAQSSAPEEVVLTRQTAHTDAFFVTPALPVGASKFAGSYDLKECLKDALKGMGMVSLVSLKVKYMATAEKQKIVCGIYNANTTLTEDELFSIDTMFAHVSTSFDFGTLREDVLVVPDTLSAQIQPTSGSLPGWKFYMHASGQMKIALEIFIKCHGPRKHITSWVFQN
jgi:hypothetical protein